MTRPEPTMVNPWSKIWDYVNPMKPQSKQNREPNLINLNIEGWKLKKNNPKKIYLSKLKNNEVSMIY